MSQSPSPGRSPVDDIWQVLTEFANKLLGRVGLEKSPGSGRAPAYHRNRALIISGVLIFLCLVVWVVFALFSNQIMQAFSYQWQRVSTVIPPSKTPTVTRTPKPTRTETPTPESITQTGTVVTQKPTRTLVPIVTRTSRPTYTATLPALPQVYHPPQWMERLGKTFINPTVLRHILTLILAAWLAWRLAVLYYQEIYGIKKYGIATRMMARVVLNLPFGKVVVKKGEIIKDELGRRALRFLKFGVPVELDIAPDSCLVVEDRSGRPSVYGPTVGYTGFLAGYTHLRRAVDLGDQRVTLTVRAQTREGILITAWNIGFTFSVYRSHQSEVQKSTLTYDEKAILNLVYRNWPEGDWVSANSAHIETALGEFIRQHTLEEFLPFSTTATGENFPRDLYLNPFTCFVEAYNTQAAERGIEIHWTNEGDWIIPPELSMEKNLDAWQQSMTNLLRRNTLASGAEGVEGSLQDLLKLINEVPISVFDEWLSKHRRSDTGVIRLVQAYCEKLNQAIQAYNSRGQPSPPELEQVIEHLTKMV